MTGSIYPIHTFSSMPVDLPEVDFPVTVKAAFRASAQRVASNPIELRTALVDALIESPVGEAGIFAGKGVQS